MTKKQIVAWINDHSKHGSGIYAEMWEGVIVVHGPSIWFHELRELKTKRTAWQFIAEDYDHLFNRTLSIGEVM